jgi:clan AA aspartic protease
MTGMVNDRLEATLRVVVAGADGQPPQEVSAVIDTGYNGAITLPPSLVAVLSLPRGASREVTLGDASRKVFDYFNAQVVWDYQMRKVRVLCVEGEPLIGTALLRGYKLESDFVPGGPVALTAVP